MEDATSVHPTFFTWVDDTVMHFVGVLMATAEHTLPRRRHTFLLCHRHRERLQAPGWSVRRRSRGAPSLADLTCACWEATLPRSGVTALCVGPPLSWPSSSATTSSSPTAAIPAPCSAAGLPVPRRCRSQTTIRNGGLLRAQS
ncbi:hypothetical protein EJB05_00211, partial [Eragrostis curvula]